MSFRARMTLLVAVAIAVTVAATSLAVWETAKHQLYGQVDAALTRAHVDPHDPFTLFIQTDGERHGQLGIPVTNRMVKAAQGQGDSYFATARIQGSTFREYVDALPGGAIVRV
jgi:hypothetical protein